MRDEQTMAIGGEAGVVRRDLPEAVRAARRAVSRMRDPEDLGEVLETIRAGLREQEASVRHCGVNLVDTASDVPTVTTHSMDRDGQWQSLPSASAQTVLQFWLGRQLVYRPDLRAHDPFAEAPHLPGIASVVDVPFAHGTLAMSSEEAEAFSEQHLQILEQMAGVLESGFDRLEELKGWRSRQRLRDRIWQLHSRQDLDEFAVILRQTLVDVGFRFHACAVNLIESEPDGLRVRSHNMEPRARWSEHQLLERPSLLERLWRRGQPTYRRDLDDVDEYGERENLRRVFGAPIRSVLDVPFSQGTLALNSTQPEAFSEAQVSELSELAGILEEAFRRIDEVQARAPDQAPPREGADGHRDPGATG